MIRAGEAANALYGAWRLARFDPSGLRYFDTSVDGFWKSFYAAVLIAPLYIVLAVLRIGQGDVGASRLIVDVLAYAINWLAFPVAMLTLVKVVDRQRFYIRHIVAYNWAGVFQNAIYLPLGILIQQDLLPLQLGALFSLLVLAWVLTYSGYVTHVALEVPGPVAAAFVLVDLVLGVTINGLAAGLG